MTPILLASKSSARAQILRQAGVAFEAAASRVDESAIKTALVAKGQGPAEIALALAEAKARDLSAGRAGLVIGADQTLEFEGRLVDKAESPDAARARLAALRGKTHCLYSAVAIAQDGQVIWGDVSSARMTMRDFSLEFLDGYMARNTDAALACLGGYEWEGEGVQLFEAVEGDYCTILGLPLLGLLAQLRDRGAILS